MQSVKIDRWDYRVILEGDVLSIRDVFYAGDKIISWGIDPLWPKGDTLEDLRADLGAMLSAFNKPVLKVINGALEEQPMDMDSILDNYGF